MGYGRQCNNCFLFARGYISFIPAFSLLSAQHSPLTPSLHPSLPPSSLTSIHLLGLSCSFPSFSSVFYFPQSSVLLIHFYLSHFHLSHRGFLSIFKCNFLAITASIYEKRFYYISLSVCPVWKSTHMWQTYKNIFSPEILSVKLNKCT